MSELSMSMFVSKDELHEARIAEAVAAERARAAQAVREIVELWEREESLLLSQGMLSAAARATYALDAARECLAAVEGKR